MAPKTLIAGIGSALVDMLLTESDAFVSASGGARGGMTLVDHNRIDALLATSSNKPSIVPGGSACNTIVGAARLGGPARFIGKRGNDALGGLLETSLKSSGVSPILSTSSLPTGRVLSVITPDAQRTMFTYLGAAAEMRPEDILAEYFTDAAIVHLEGYLLFNYQLTNAALAAARKAGALISLDLASFTVVEANKAFIDEIVEKYIDILIANEDEARAYTGCLDEEKAMTALASKAATAILKLGKRGSVIAHKGAVTTVGIMGDGKAVDTTGAGDLWAAGFLHGLVNGHPIEKCGAIASACGYEVCQVIGAAIPEEGWNRIKKVVIGG